MNQVEFEVTFPWSPRALAMLSDAFRAEGMTVSSAGSVGGVEQRDATAVASLAVGTAALVVTAADSKAVHDVIAKVSGRLGGRLNATVTPKHRK